MAGSKAALRVWLALLLVTLSGLLSPGQGLRINYINPRRGSIAGGTKVTVYGSGFSTDAYASTNLIFFGNVPCDVNWYTATSTQLQCVTLPYPDAIEEGSSPELQSLVISNGEYFLSTHSDERFIYHWNYTPQVWEVLPSSGTSGSVVSIGVYRHGSLDEFDRLYIGDNICDLRDPETNEYYGSFWRWPLSYVKCRITEQKVGSWNVTAKLDKWSRGLTWRHSLSLYPAHDWELAMFELYPDIHGVYPREGPPQGGTLITIVGAGFGVVQDDVAVDVDGVPCHLVYHSQTVLRCWTGKPADDSVAIAAENGIYPQTDAGFRFRGGRGVTQLQYRSIGGSSIENLHSSNLYPDSPSHYGIYPSFSTEDWSKRNNYGERLMAFFNPRESGVHSFYVTSDDQSQLLFAAGSNISATTKIAESPWAISWDVFDRYSEQQSLPFDLSTEEDYLLVGEFKESGGDDFIQVGVLMHDTTGFTYDQTKQVQLEKQVVQLRTEGLYDIQQLHLSLNTSEDDSSEVVLSWGDRVSGPIALLDIVEDPELLRDEVLSLSGGECQFDGDWKVVHYDKTIFGFEEGDESESVWAAWSGESPEVVDHETFCGRRSLHVPDSRTLAFNLNPADYDGFKVTDYPSLCLAYKLPPGHEMAMVLNIADHGWHTVPLFSNEVDFHYPTLKEADNVLFFDRFSSEEIRDDDNWHYACTDLQQLVETGLTAATTEETNEVAESERSTPQYQILGFGFFADQDPQRRGFYIDELSFSSDLREFNPEEYLPPGRPNGVSLHDIIITSDSVTMDDVMDVDISMEIIPSTCDYDIPLIDVEINSTGSAAVLESSFVRIQNASKPFGGTFSFIFNGMQSVNISHDAGVEEIQAALEAIAGAVTVELNSQPLEHDLLGHFCPGREFMVQFEALFGDQPSLEVDVTHTTGDNLQTTVSEVVKGGLFLRPIPGHMLQTVETTPQVHVRVKGQLASCSGGNALYAEVTSSEWSDWCGFTYNPSVSPSVTEISPTTAVEGDTILISGSGFGTASDQLVVQFDEAACSPTSVTDSQLQCTLGAGFAGAKSLHLHVLSKGVADTNNVQLLYDLRASALSPAAGSAVGGTEIAITGVGFVTESVDSPRIPEESEFASDYVPFLYETAVRECSNWENIVFIGDKECEITSETNTLIVCVTPLQDTQLDATYNVTVLVRCTDAENGEQISALAGVFMYDTSVSPTVTGISPENGTVIGGESVTIFGSGFSTTMEDNQVQFGDSLCTITSVSATSIICTTTSHPRGTVDVSVRVQGKGRADGDVQFSYVVRVDSISHCSGSLFGGQKIALKGIGFGSSSSVVRVTTGGVPCEIQDVEDTQITCVTGSSVTTHYINNNAHHPEYGLGYKWNPEELSIDVGDTVQWSWTGSDFATRRSVVQVDKPGDTEYNAGFRSKESVTGTFQYAFTTPGTYYYIAGGFGHIDFNGTIIVQPLRTKPVSLAILINSIEVSLDDPAPLCEDSAMMDTYSYYMYSIFNTPTVRLTEHEATIGDMLSIHTEHISQNPADNTLTIGGKPCMGTDPTSASSIRMEPDFSGPVAWVVLYETELFACTVPDLEPGVYRVVMHVNGKGWAYADLSTSTVLYQPAITNSVSPQSGSFRGGLLLNVAVPDLSPVDVAKTRVDIGNTPCPVQRIHENHQVTCLTQAARDDGYSSVVAWSGALAYWSLQTDYFDDSGSYLLSEGITNFRSGGALSDIAEAAISGAIVTRMEGISGNSLTDQSVQFDASYIEVPPLEEFTSPTGFGMELWVRATDSNSMDKYIIVVDASSTNADTASGYILALNPCDQLEFWVATGIESSSVSPPDYSDCAPINITSYNCSQQCQGHAYMENTGSATGELPPGVWHVIRSGEYNWTSWHQVALGWNAGDYDNCTFETAPCSGEQTLYIDGQRIGSFLTPHLPSYGTPITIGGTSKLQIGSTPNSAYDIEPFVGQVDEVSFYSSPLSQSAVSQHYFYGASENQPIWVTVEGQDGVGTGVVPNVEYPEWEVAFEDEVVVDWDGVQNNDLTVENSSAIRFEWTGLHGIREVTRSVYESCDLEGDYRRQWTPKQLGGSVTVVLETGAIYYFIDSVVDNCLQGNKLKVQIGEVERVEWRIARYDDMTITQGTGLLFEWDGVVSHNLIEMASPLSTSRDCTFVGTRGNEVGQVVREWHPTASTSGEVTVSGLSLGDHHFVCSVPGHCQAGMRFTVSVVAGDGPGDEQEEEEGPYEHVIPWKIQYYDTLITVEGEPITFRWDGFHSLIQVSKEAFDSCDVAAVPLHNWGDPSVDNSATISHLSSGTYYFVCSVSGHCDAGMKIQIDVLPSDGLPVFTLPIDAECRSTSGFCAFSYSVENTPQLFAAMPAEVYSGSVLTVVGSGLLPPGAMEGSQTTEVVIWVDKAPCTDVTIVNVTAMEVLQCTVTDYITGLYPVQVFVSGKGYATVVPEPIFNHEPTEDFEISPNLIVFLEGSVSSITPNSGSTAGGMHVTLSGSGFSHIPSDISVSMEGIPCDVVSSSRSEIVCITGASLSTSTQEVDVSIVVNGYSVPNSFQYMYNSANTPQITTISQGIDLLPGEMIIISGNGFGTDSSNVVVQVVPVGQEFDFSLNDLADTCTVDAVTVVTIDCTVPSRSAGTYNVLVHIAGLGLADGDAEINYLLDVSSFSPVSSGYGGGVTLTLAGEGFPEMSADEPITVSVCDNECNIVTSSRNQLECTVSPHHAELPLDDMTDCPVKVTYKQLELIASESFTFLAERTPIVESITPTTGGTAGGTIVTITGAGLLPPGKNSSSLIEQDIVVTIDGAPCIWLGQSTLPTDTSIECRTSEHVTTLSAMVSVHVEAKGFALVTGDEEDVLFEYVDRWSSTFTWGGGPLPQEGDSVYIKSGQTVLLDIDTPVLNLILVEGSLIFEDEQNLHLQAKYIFINYGKLQVGTEEEPFMHDATITLHGSVSDPEIPIYGAKVLGIRQGELDLHGRPRAVTWTHLQQTAHVNETEVRVQVPVDWVAGDRIVIAPTGKDGNETEERTVLSVSGDGHTITVDEPLTFTHHGITDVYEDGQFIDIRAEVGLLTHNVVVEGTRLLHPTGYEQPGQDQYGSQIFIHRMGPHPTPIRIEHTEIRYGGQAFQLGRYAVHFHLSGSMSGSYIKNCAIHHSNNRAITAHGVHDLLIEGNVAYDIKGHTFFVEDGIETNNRYIRNLGVLTRGSSSLLNTDQVPATFWITNPQNTFVGNAAVASRAYGFWYDLDDRPSGASYTTSVCPNKEPFGEFRDNVAHTCSEFGLRIWETYQPHVDGCQATEQGTATLYGFTTYSNGIHGLELSVVAGVRLNGFKVADNVDNGIEIQETLNWWGWSAVENTLIVSHTSANDGEPQTGGIKTPNTPYLTVSNVTFVNFNLPSTSCLRACSQCKVFQGGFQVEFEKLKFIGGSDQHKTYFQWEHEVLYHDLDGTLTGLVGGWATPNSGLHPPQYCTASVPEFSVNPNFHGSVCTSDVYFLRMAWNQADPRSTLTVDVNVTNQFGHSIVPWRHYRLTHLDGYMLTMPSGHEHTISWILPIEHEVDTTYYNAGMYGVRREDYAWITHEFVQKPDHVNVGGNYEPTEHGEVPLPDDPNLSWHMTNETNGTDSVTYLISGSDSTSTNTQHNVLWNYRYEPCPRVGCPPPDYAGDYDHFTRRWSNPNNWPGKVLPQEGEDVTIISRWRMILDIVPPTLGRVYILGELVFEDTQEYNFTADLILVHGPNGRLIIGTESTPFTHPVTITLNGRRGDEGLALSSGIIVGSKAFAIFGNVSIHGESKTRTWTRLATSALAGNNQLVLQGNDYPNWLPQETVVIAPSGWDPEEAEIRTIVDYDKNTGVVTLDEPLQFDHLVRDFLEPSDLESGPEYGEPLDGGYWWGDGGSLAPEVGLLTRSIVIQGGEHPDEPLEHYHYGCRVLVGSYSDDHFTYSGHLWADSVEFRYCGQGGYYSPRDPRYSIAFRNNFDASRDDYIRRCSIHHGYNTAIGIHTSNGVEVSQNVIWRTTDSSVKSGGHSNELLDNLAMMTTTVQPNRPKDSHAVDFPATFDIDGGNTVRGNAAAGSTRLAFRFTGEPCLEGRRAPTYDEASFWDNTAHTGLLGLNVLGLSRDCTAIGGFTSAFQWNYAVFTSTASSLAATHLRVAVGKVGLNLNVFGPNPVAHQLGGKTISVSDSLIVGSLPNEECVTVAPEYLVVPLGLNDHKLGIMMSSFNQRRSKMDGTGQWHLMKGYPVIDGGVFTTNLTFARFFDAECRYGIYCIGNNPLSPDAVHPMYMTGTSLFNVEKNSLAFFYEPDVGWIVQEDCVDMDCDGLKHALVRDLDGRLVGSHPEQGSVVPFAEIRFDDYVDRIPETWRANSELGVERASVEQLVDHMGVARGGDGNLDADNGGCVWVVEWQAYCCKTLTHHMLIIESMDGDTETRRLSPLALNGGDTGHGRYTDLLNGPMDHGWCTYYTCLKRLSTFFSIVTTGTDYWIWTTGSLPQGLRFHLLNAEEDDVVRLNIWYKSPLRKDIYKNGIFIEPENVRYFQGGAVQQLDGDHKPGFDRFSGANYFERESQFLHLIVKGSEPIEIRAPPVVQVSLNLAVSIDDFFDPTALIYNLAFVLKIDVSRIRIVEIIAEDSPVGKRSLLSADEFSQTSITFEFGDPPAINISSPETPSVAEEVAMAGGDEESVDIEDHTVSESDTPTPEASNSLDEDPPADVLEFADEFNASVATYTESVQQYEEMVAEVEAINEVAEMLVNQILTGEIELENATVTGITVVPATPPAPPSTPVIPPSFENITAEPNITIAVVEEVPTSPPLPVDEEEEEEVVYTIPVEMRVTMEPSRETGHLIHVSVAVFDANGVQVHNLGLVHPWLCNATLIHDYLETENPPQLEGEISTPFVNGEATFTRLRVSHPAEQLTLVFQTDPARFEVRTSVKFNVVAPPSRTPRQTVQFVLAGDVSALNLEDVAERAVVVESIRQSLSEYLDIDGSRVKDIVLTVSPTGLAVEADILDRQFTDPPDVPTLNATIATLASLVTGGDLVIYIDNTPYTAVDTSFTNYEPTTAPTSSNDYLVLGLAVCGAIGSGVVMVVVIVALRCLWVRSSKRRKVARRKETPTDMLLPPNVIKVNPAADLYGDSDSELELERTSTFNGSSYYHPSAPSHPHSMSGDSDPLAYDYQSETDQTSLGTATEDDCWATPTHPPPPLYPSSSHFSPAYPPRFSGPRSQPMTTLGGLANQRPPNAGAQPPALYLPSPRPTPTIFVVPAPSSAPSHARSGAKRDRWGA